jgi:WD40 repeat protein
MTTIDPNVVDTLLVQELRERAADLGDEDRFYQQVMATISVVPQRRWFRSWPARFGRRTSLVLVAAALVSLLALAAGVGAFLRSHPAPPVRPAVWSVTGTMINDHVLHTATLLSDGKVLVAGGVTEGDEPGHAELYDPASGSWTATRQMSAGRHVHTATLLPDGRVLVAGGEASPTTTELYDPRTRSWIAAASMIHGRVGHTATLLPDGRVLVAGGAGTAVAELFDPSTGTWTATGPMVHEHDRHTATLLRDGTVLVAGGGQTAVAELYDPRTDTWTATGPMAHGHWDCTATLLPDGTVLVAGGESTRSAELYDPHTGLWTETGSMSFYAQHTATLLPDGLVLVTGGGGGNGSLEEAAQVEGVDFAKPAELYDPRTGTWTKTASMSIKRGGHTATLLPDGRVLVAGGWGDNSVVLRSAELYQPGTGN